MRFKSILSLFREDDWTRSLMETFDQMLVLSGDMFAYTMNVLVQGTPDADPAGRVFEPDKRINALMRQIRRRVVSRLSLGGSRGEVPTALIFMNAVKDAERIGDYVKNIHDVTELLPAQPDRQLYAEWLADRSARIDDLFARTRRAFSTSDDEGAARVIADTRALGRECEKAIVAITESNLTTRDAVCLALVLRFLKRIASHQSNIATTVVMPIDLLDFHDEGPMRP
ncbi:MAG: PhoU domain-containing protein [Candidatus Krumholzibacteria bacterium]|jgi:phosphate uptake regulator|nr:PhoU domain-containing protein [Candidatus Krumholzibacteria bacterium]